MMWRVVIIKVLVSSSNLKSDVLIELGVFIKVPPLIVVCGVFLVILDAQSGMLVIGYHFLILRFLLLLFFFFSTHV